MLSEQVRAQTDRELKKYPANQKQSAVMSALRFVQEEKGWISNDDMTDVADYLSMPQIAVYEVATFYNMYHLKPMGRHMLTVCTNLSCQLVGSDETMAYIKNKLGIEAGEVTADGKFGLRAGECQNMCDEAPVLMLDNKKTCGHLTPAKIDQLLLELSK